MPVLIREQAFFRGNLLKIQIKSSFSANIDTISRMANNKNRQIYESKILDSSKGACKHGV